MPSDGETGIDNNGDSLFIYFSIYISFTNYTDSFKVGVSKKLGTEML